MFPSQTDISSFKVYNKNNVTDFQRNRRHKIRSREEFLFSIAPVCYSKWLFLAIYKSIWLCTIFFIVFDFQMEHWILFCLLFRLLPFHFGVLSDAQMEMCNSSLQLFNFNFQWQYFNFCSISFIQFRIFFSPSRVNVWSMSFLFFANGMVFFSSRGFIRINWKF